jgi:hypothetical protein
MTGMDQSVRKWTRACYRLSRSRIKLPRAPLLLTLLVPLLWSSFRLESFVFSLRIFLSSRLLGIQLDVNPIFSRLGRASFYSISLINASHRSFSSELERVSVSSSTSTTTLSLPLSAKPVGRHIPRLAKSYLERLFEKYGTDVEKMSRDGKLNPEQRTAGELRRGFRLLGIL